MFLIIQFLTGFKLPNYKNIPTKNRCLPMIGVKPWTYLLPWLGSQDERKTRAGKTSVYSN